MPDWKDLAAPSLADIEALADAAFAALPAEFKAMCDRLVIHVEDFPDEETMEEMDCETEFDLLGLFRGRGLAQGAGAISGEFPNMVWLYRRPILDYWGENEDTLGEIVTLRELRPGEATRRLEGPVVAVDETGVTLDDAEHGRTRVAFDSIDRARTVFKWGAEAKPTPSRGKASTTTSKEG